MSVRFSASARISAAISLRLAVAASGEMLPSVPPSEARGGEGAVPDVAEADGVAVVLELQGAFIGEVGKA